MWLGGFQNKIGVHIFLDHTVFMKWPAINQYEALLAENTLVFTIGKKPFLFV